VAPLAPAGGESATAASLAVRAPVRQASVVPDWLANLASLGWRLVAISFLVVTLWLIANLLWTVTASIAVAVVVSALFAPWVLRLRERGRSPATAAAIVWAAAIAVIAVVLLVLAVAFVPYLADVVRWLQQSLAQVQSDLASLGLPPFVGELVRDILGAVLAATGAASGTVVASIAAIGTVLVLATFLVFFFLKDGDKAWFWMFQGVSDVKRERITAAGDDALTRVGGYLRGTTILSAIIALTDLVFMLILGVPVAVPLAVLVFLSGYIPYFGGIVTTAIILLVTYVALGTGPVLVMLGLIAIRNVILGYGIRPALYGRSVNIHPALVLVVLPAGFQLAGVVGLFAAVPVTAVVFAVARATIDILEPDPPPPLPGLVPAWVDRVAQWSWRFLVVIAMIALGVGIVVAIPAVVIPVVLGTIIAASLDPIVGTLVRRGWSRTRASAVTLGGTALAIMVLIGLAVVSLAGAVEPLASATVDGAGSIDEASGGALGLVVEAIRQGSLATAQTVYGVVSSLATVAAIAALGTLLGFYILRDGATLGGSIVEHARVDARDDLATVGRRAYEVLGGYMGGTAAISFVGAASQLVIMVLLGIPYALPVFVLSFILCFIPYIGGFISTGIALLLTISVGSPLAIAVMIVWTLVFNIVTGNIVSPLVYGRTVHLHPAVVLVAIPAGSAVAGVLGMFLVVPVIGIVAATWRTVLRVASARAAARAALGGGGPFDAVPEPAE
jgi:predicted PurR-regulated permease PerM